jgi:hypothetical protein
MSKPQKKADASYIQYVEVIGLSGGFGTAISIAAGELHSRFFNFSINAVSGQTF